MDLRKVKKLIELLEESNVAEIEIHEGEESVRISRMSKVAHVAAPPAMEYAPPAARAAAPAAAPAAPAAEAVPQNAVTAPMVGTFYGSPAPGSPPFVTIGQRIKRGDIICIIEAMKIMNQIESDRDGVVQAVLAENGKPVEFGQPLIQVG